jgi:hypothetical protein
MRASRIQGGQEKYERLCGTPQFYEDPLDAAFSGERLSKRRKWKEGIMTGEEFKTARGELGHKWGLGRPLTLTEFGRVLRLGGVRPDQSVRDYERGKTAVSGPLSLLIELMLAGAQPANLKSLLP